MSQLAILPLRRREGAVDVVAKLKAWHAVALDQVETARTKHLQARWRSLAADIAATLWDEERT